jgi:hypothetical protein
MEEQRGTIGRMCVRAFESRWKEQPLLKRVDAL